MSKLVNLGNGNVLIGLDKHGQVKDFYFHFAGLENHVGEKLVHKVGLFVEDNFSWLDDGAWNIEVGTEKDTMASKIVAKNSHLGIEINFCDVVYNEKNIFIREVTVKNTFDRNRKVKLYFNQQFNIAQTHIGDTAYYDPRGNVIVHYKGRRAFLINAYGTEYFDEYSVGLLGIEGKDGTYKDAEDGKLSGNAIEHGQVDSVIGMQFNLSPKSEKKVYYWITIAKSIDKAKRLNELVVSRKPADIILSTKNYWKAWVKNQNFTFYGLGPPIVDLFNRSLINIRTHVNKNGSIIASGDSEMLQFGRDYYEYVWPRDAAFAAIALERAGDFNASKRFFQFCADVISDEGYFMHKYRPDKSLGSSWHPWVRNGKKQYPIQEDETALVLYALWQHYVLSKDLEFIENIYNGLIKKSAEFMVNYRDDKTGLPAPSYDLWEMHYAVHTFTSSSVYGALIAASKFARLLGKSESEKKYKSAAEQIKKAILKHLYDSSRGVFYKNISVDGKKVKVDETIDISSVYGIYKFGVLPETDMKLKKAFDKTIERLELKTQVGGLARFEGDTYHRNTADVPGNPWIVVTMWVAQYYIALAKNEKDMEPVKRRISWAVKHASFSGVLPEQIDPFTGEHVSAAPLTWSHAEFVTTIIMYLEKLESLGICEACYPVT